MKAAIYGDWYLDGDIFTSFLKECLVPVLHPGKIVFMDNLRTHKVAGIKELIEATGVKLIYLPPWTEAKVLAPGEFYSSIKKLAKPIMVYYTELLLS